MASIDENPCRKVIWAHRWVRRGDGLWLCVDCGHSQSSEPAEEQAQIHRGPKPPERERPWPVCEHDFVSIYPPDTVVPMSRCVKCGATRKSG